MQSLFSACPICARVMTLVKHGRQGLKVFRCPSHKGHKMSQLSGSFFEDCHLPLVKVVGMIFCWAHDIPNHLTVTMVGVSADTVVSWFKVRYLLDVYLKTCTAPTNIHWTFLITETERRMHLVSPAAPTANWGSWNHCRN